MDTKTIKMLKKLPRFHQVDKPAYEKQGVFVSVQKDDDYQEFSYRMDVDAFFKSGDEFNMSRTTKVFFGRFER